MSHLNDPDEEAKRRAEANTFAKPAPRPKAPAAAQSPAPEPFVGHLFAHKL